ncbi:MAG: tRNA pseudouridine synthase A [Phycisphaerales bacterium]
MPRYKLTVAYDGTAFHGWQKQEPLAPDPDDPLAPRLPGEPEALEDKPGRVALRTVQHVLEQAVRETIREPITLVGASRTDAGVHAWGQVAAFTSIPDPDRGVGWPAERGCDTLVRALNARLPDDLLVRDAEVVDDAFEPIGGATSKGYSYTIHASPTRPLWDRRYVYHTWHELDVAKMQEAARHLVGTHDFASLAAAGHGRQTTVRTIFSCAVTELPPVVAFSNRPDPPPPGGAGVPPAIPFLTTRLRIDVTGDGFLYNMVRILAGTLVEVGRGKLEANSIPKILESRDRANAGPTLPPEGLRLEWIRYT